MVLARSLKGKPLAITLAGEKLVFFRDAKQVAHALLDQCPHRGVALSLGKVTEEGCLQCPFHAWEFDGSGAVTHVPLNPEAKRERLFAKALPTREIGGVLWVFTAAVKDAGEPTVPDGLTMPGVSRTFLQVEWNAHWTRAMENMLDSPHVPFLHATTIGRFVRPYLKRDSTMAIEWEDTEYGGRTTSTVDAREGSGAALDFFRPNMMVLHIPIPNRVFRMHAFCVPIDEGRVRMIIIGARSFATFPLLNLLFNRTNAKIAEQDRAVVESSRPVKIPQPGQELSVRTDKATLQFRKYFFEQLEGSTSTPAA